MGTEDTPPSLCRLEACDTGYPGRATAPSPPGRCCVMSCGSSLNLSRSGWLQHMNLMALQGTRGRQAGRQRGGCLHPRPPFPAPGLASPGGRWIAPQERGAPEGCMQHCPGDQSHFLPKCFRDLTARNPTGTIAFQLELTKMNSAHVGLVKGYPKPGKGS
jgi:hypothetical protein